MCRLPVTFGGGQGIMNVSRGVFSGNGKNFVETSGLKNPCADHQSYHADSTAIGLYPADIGSNKSMRALGGIVLMS